MVFTPCTRTIPHGHMAMQVAYAARMHPYQGIADVLRQRIVSGDLRPGDLVPTAADLIASHGVSRVTARRALTALRDEGLIDLKQGRPATVTGGHMSLPDRVASLESAMAEVRARLCVVEAR